MMTEGEQFLEALKDPLRFSVRKAAFDFHNMNKNYLIIHDLRIQQVNELPNYRLILITTHPSKHFTLHNDFVDMLEEYVPASAQIDWTTVDERQPDRFVREYAVYDKSLMGFR